MGLVACTKDFDAAIEAPGEGLISFTLGQAETITTKSSLGEGPTFLLTSPSGACLPVVCETTMMENSIFGDELTKGQHFNNAEEFKDETFGVYGWYPSGDAVYTAESVTRSSTGIWWPANKKPWDMKTSLTFEAYYPKECSARTFTNLSGKKLDFSYTLPAAGGDQADLMFAYYSGSGSDNTLGAGSTVLPGTAKMTFTHALTCVRFKIGTMVDVLKIKSIELKNVYASGSCTVSTENAPAYVWTPGTANKTVSTTKDFALPETTLQLKDDPDYTFLLIPQDLAVNPVTLTIVITAESGDHTLSVVLDGTQTRSKGTGTEWEAGVVNTYVLGYDGEKVTVAVDDDVDGLVKKNLAISNTGTSDAYIRAAIVGNWVDASGFIVADWDETQGTFADFPGTNWVKVGAYYYYQNPVDKAVDDSTPTEITDKLFSTYTAPSTVPVEGATLNISIIVQGVKYDSAKAKVTDAWGATVASHLNIK